MSTLTLTEDQQAAYDAFVSFITNPTETVWVLRGYAGTGKSTLVRRLLDDLPATLQTVHLISQKKKDWELVLTATTNKACEALSQITGQEVVTIHSFLNLRVETNHKFRTNSLVPRGGHRGQEIHENKIIFIDEASFADRELLSYLFKFTENCKIILIGDPAQLAPPQGGPYTPAFTSGFKTSSLNTVVRQAAGNPITALATGFRNTVNGADWPSGIQMDGTHLIHLPRKDFEQAILDEFQRPDYENDDAKVLAYRNSAVIAYNKGIREQIEGVPHLEVGDYAVCNSFIGNKQCTVKTDQTVMITGISEATEYGVDGWTVTMDYRHVAFLPALLEEKKERIAAARLAEDWNLVQYIADHWIDLRAAFACTINKSQGSTYNKVFIDLDDVRSCTNQNTKARLMYVAVSRARHTVVMTGDLVAAKQRAA